MSVHQTSTQNPFVLKKSASLWQLLIRVYGYLRPYWKRTAASYLSLLGIIALSASIPQFIRWIIDTGIGMNQPGVLTWSVLALLGLTLVKGVLNYFQGILSETASQNVAYDLRNEIQKKLTQLSFSFHDTSEAGELLSRAIQDVERLRFLTGRATIRILDGILMIIVTMIILIVMDYRLGLFVLVSMPILIHRAYYFGSRFRPLSLMVQKQVARLTTAVEQNLRGSRVVKAYAQEPKEIERFEEENQRWFDLTRSAARLQAVNVPLMFLLSNIGMVVIVLFGGYLVIQQELTFGVLIAFITYMGQLVEPVRRLGIIIPAVAIAGSSAERIFDILDTVPDVQDEPDAQPMAILEGHVKFEQVSFSYGRQTVLHDIDFEALPGQIVALLGATGSGKSTIISLIPRFYDPTAGKILVDGKDIRQATLNSLRSQIGIVLQETTLFAASIRENIAFGQSNATEEDIIAAAKAAQGHEFIVRSPKGYDTYVGERGITLSGGQKQRIAIARVLLMNPRLLILDDATASVDTETEHLIQTAFENLIKGRTTFVIAHRLSTVRNADLILVLDHGQIVARGTHESLLKTSKQYLEIYNRQLKHQEVAA
ncbi:MAG: ABC transporter ATP-binding protein [Chloroflexi bacterium HGW-Chloroflexi-2]|jgi:ATP-binding cassette subfamily B protein|nr:MAG: ABC transporter ATP-binding protein [Chloroflexi bacterium HGW-Chloroflexi-2]